MLFLADARDVLAAMNDESVDLIVTDPPYRTISGGTSTEGRPTGILDKNDGKIFKHNSLNVEDYAAHMFRVLKPSTHCYVMVNFLNLEHFMKAFRDAGFHIHNIIIWDKGSVTPNRWYMKGYEMILMMAKRPVKTINDPGQSNIIRGGMKSGGRRHPTEKPVNLMKTLIQNSSVEGDTVLDPFCGSGSTLVACVVIGRSYIGVEIDPDHFQTAVDRLYAVEHGDT
jgi:site-specific DNA-methyltransferase (adenine-specific)